MDKSKAFTRKEIVDMLYDPEPIKEELEDYGKDENVEDKKDLRKTI